MHLQVDVGTIIDDRFEIKSLLGQGAGGSVYLAKQADLNRDVALKFLHLYLVTDQDSIARFEREGRILAKLRNENIISCYRYGLWQHSVPYMAMEYLEGSSLRELLNRERKIPWNHAVEYALQICRGLNAAHKAGIVHRDLKPQNILLAKVGENIQLKLLDFGLARILTPFQATNDKLTQTGYLIGTPEYMSPEQGTGAKVDHRSDIYSFGCILYEMIAGRLPYESPTTIGYIFLHAKEPVPPLSKYSPNTCVPVVLEELIMRCLEKDPEKRFQLAEQIIEDLELIRTSSSLEMTKPISPRTSNSAGTNSTVIISTATIAVLAIVGSSSIFTVGSKTNGAEKTIDPTKTIDETTPRKQNSNADIENCNNSEIASNVANFEEKNTLDQIDSNLSPRSEQKSNFLRKHLLKIATNCQFYRDLAERLNKMLSAQEARYHYQKSNDLGTDFRSALSSNVQLIRRQSIELWLSSHKDTARKSDRYLAYYDLQTFSSKSERQKYSEEAIKAFLSTPDNELSTMSTMQVLSAAQVYNFLPTQLKSRVKSKTILDKCFPYLLEQYIGRVSVIQTMWSCEDLLNLCIDSGEAAKVKPILVKAKTALQFCENEQIRPQDFARVHAYLSLAQSFARERDYKMAETAAKSVVQELKPFPEWSSEVLKASSILCQIYQEQHNLTAFDTAYNTILKTLPNLKLKWQDRVPLETVSWCLVKQQRLKEATEFSSLARKANMEIANSLQAN